MDNIYWKTILGKNLSVQCLWTGKIEQNRFNYNWIGENNRCLIIQKQVVVETRKAPKSQTIS